MHHKACKRWGAVAMSILKFPAFSLGYVEYFDILGNFFPAKQGENVKN
jgi:hypothetical protein